MKSFVDFLTDTNPKTVNKVTKAFDKTGSSAYMSAFMEEATSGSEVDFPKVKCMITNNFICGYDMTFVNNQIFVLPLNQVTNIYRGNINYEDKYDFSGFSLFVDTTDGSRVSIQHTLCSTKKINIYDEVIDYVKNKLSISGKEA